MSNLVKNALKATKRGVIEVSAEYMYDTNMLCVTVKDTGAGVKPEDIPGLFTRFGKMHRTARINDDGIGLGLTIVKTIVEAH